MPFASVNRCARASRLAGVASNASPAAAADRPCSLDHRATSTVGGAARGRAWRRGEGADGAIDGFR